MNYVQYVGWFNGFDIFYSVSGGYYFIDGVVGQFDSSDEARIHTGVVR